jgi:hypothetical protein
MAELVTVSRENFVSVYRRWRHGGWYVDNVRYANGAVGCVSRNFPDKKWRIVCGRSFDETFKSRDDAAYAEYLLTLDKGDGKAVKQ